MCNTNDNAWYRKHSVRKVITINNSITKVAKKSSLIPILHVIYSILSSKTLDTVAVNVEGGVVGVVFTRALAGRRVS